MNVFARLHKTKNDWKTKAVYRATLLRDFRKKLGRIKARSEQRRRQLKQEIKRLNSEIATLRLAANKSTQLIETSSPIELRTLCVSIVIGGIVSFRSVPRILGVFQSFGGALFPIPHFTSVIHWSLRAGVAVFSQVSRVSGPWIAIIDCSIDIGTRKALVVLRISLEALQNKQGAVGLQDCECIGLKISTKWNGTLVNEALKEIFDNAGRPIAILKDGGTDLNKGVQLYRETENAKQIIIIDDVGHVTANALKAEFSKQTAFVKFLNILRKGAARIRQTDLAWLLPPKIRTKGRFQGITEVAEWAQKLLNVMGGQGRAKESSELNLLRRSFNGLAQLREFLGRFCGACEISEKFLKIMKQKGLNQETYREAKNHLLQMPENSTVRLRLQSWLDKHLHIQCRLGVGQLPLLVSSDVIESLFGKFKTVIQRNPNAELNRLVYIIPLLCGKHSKGDLNYALQNCSHQQMLDQIEKTIPQTLRQQRHRILERGREQTKTGTVPLPRTG